MHLFLDTNIYLGFYKLSGDDLEQLRKLSITVGEGVTRLHLTEQVRDEYERNRDKTIADSLAQVEQGKLPTGFPRLVQDYPEYADLRRSLREFEASRQTLLSTARGEAKDRELHADRLIRELWDRLDAHARTSEILDRARVRAQIGNPPGKGPEAFGDAINWEILLEVVPDGEDLLVVSGDTDFSSALDKTKLDPFLAGEWERRKHSAINLYPSLSSLFKEHYPDITLASELQRELSVSKLVSSGSFSSTHAAIVELSNHPEFSGQQAQTMVEAANRNTQIKWILGDPDVKAFFESLVRTHPDAIATDEVARLTESIRQASALDGGESPTPGWELDLDW